MTSSGIPSPDIDVIEAPKAVRFGSRGRRCGLRIFTDESRRACFCPTVQMHLRAEEQSLASYTRNCARYAFGPGKIRVSRSSKFVATLQPCWAGVLSSSGHESLQNAPNEPSSPSLTRTQGPSPRNRKRLRRAHRPFCATFPGSRFPTFRS
jgi:hypothetical protein